MTDVAELLEIAHLAGVGHRYVRQDDVVVDTSPDSLRAVLAGLGFDTSTDSTRAESLARLRARAAAALPALIVTPADAPVLLSPRSDAASFDWRMTLEDGASVEGRAMIETREGRRVAQLPAQPMGYHRLEALGVVSTLIVAPERCWLPARLAGGGRGWGVTAQVYGLASQEDTGIGGFHEIAQLARGAGELGASFLGLSPLHAMFSSDRGKHSPYSPSNRMMLEPLFIDPFQAPGFTESAGRSLLDDPAFSRRLAEARGQRLVDYHEVWSLKRALLEPAWQAFSARGPNAAFDAFRREGGEALESHTLFEALSERFQAQGLNWIGEWPAAYRHRHTPESREAATQERARMDFHAWLQWVADTQLSDAARGARDAGMEVGLYRDLAVGADGSGSEAWCDPGAYATGLAIGAPPDPLGPLGQNWGLPAMHPMRLEQDGLLAFRRLVAANMRHAGAIRIDHAFQLERLFLIPDGASAYEGAYVAYPFEALLASLRIESHRAQSVVIAEDLGTAPAGFSDAIMRSGILSYRLLLFERTADGGFVAPERYPQDALAAVSTHDLPTLAGWWRSADIDTRACFGLTDSAQSETLRRMRSRERRQLIDALDANALSRDASDEGAPVLPVFRYLARTPCALLALQAEDLARDPHQANVPGPSQGYPNWRRRLPMDVETLCAPRSLMARSAVAMSEEGRGADRAAARLDAPAPRATYRLQFHAGFTFADAAKLAPYLASLGVSHVYASPIQTARPGSTHGYDIVDHGGINPELGGEPGFLAFSQALRDNDLKLLLDIVPNHMGVGGADNAWWLSTLEWGELSPHARAFDIDWERLGANRKLVLPFLGKPYGHALRDGELQLRFNAEEGSFAVWCYEHCFPLNPLDYRILIDWAQVAGGAGAEMRPLLAISEELREFVDAPRPVTREGRVERCEQLKAQLARIARRSPRISDAIDKAVTYANGDKATPESFGPLHRLLERQSYRLASWRVATAEINYRRFFDINALAGVRVEDEAVFEATHALIFRLIADGHVHGLRIDHVDGLADPQGYLERLQGRVGPGFYVVVEKILEAHEKLRPWPIAGTTGYEALNQIDGLFVAQETAEAFDAIYEKATESSGAVMARTPYEDQFFDTKIELLATSFGSELESLVSDVKRAADADLLTSDIPAASLRRALSETIAALPVYRTYLTESVAMADDEALIRESVDKAKGHTALEDTSAHDLFANLLLAPPDAERSPSSEALLKRIRRRFQQLSGPVMAKSLEDTLFYRYHRFMALNEVGGDPSRFGVSADLFHDMNTERAQLWPASMLASATHDMKRGEDLRARLLALSHKPDAFARLIGAAMAGGGDAPDANDRFALAQTIFGAWPVNADGAPDNGDDSFRDRLFGYAEKALREGKRRSSWTSPDQAYETATRAWIESLLAPGPWREALQRDLPAIAEGGYTLALSRVALKLTIPGAPDFYQGCEFSDFSLVDPDNRRSVDFTARAQALEGAQAAQPFDTLKQAVAAALLRDRVRSPALYARGDYAVIDAPRGWVGFERRHGRDRLRVVVCVSPFDAEAQPFAPSPHWRNLLSGAALAKGGDKWLRAVVFKIES